MKAKTFIAATVAAFAVSLPAYSADDDTSSGATSAAPGQGYSGGGPAVSFRLLDKNNDGYLSRDEVQGTPYEMDFSSIDKDADGQLSREEHTAALGDSAVPESDKEAASGTSAGANGAASGGTSSGDGSR